MSSDTHSDSQPTDVETQSDCSQKCEDQQSSDGKMHVDDPVITPTAVSSDVMEVDSVAAEGKEKGSGKGSNNQASPIMRPTPTEISEEPAEKLSRSEDDDEQKRREREKIFADLSGNLESIRSRDSLQEEKEIAIALIQSAISGQVGEAGTQWCVTHMREIASALIKGLAFERDDSLVCQLESLLEFCNNMVGRCIKEKDYLLLDSLIHFLHYFFQKLEDVSVSVSRLEEQTDSIQKSGKLLMVGEVTYYEYSMKYFVNYYSSIGGFDTLINLIMSTNPAITPPDRLLPHEDVSFDLVSTLLEIMVTLKSVTHEAVRYLVENSHKAFIPWMMGLTLQDISPIVDDDGFEKKLRSFVWNNYDIHRLSHKHLDESYERNLNTAMFRVIELLLHFPKRFNLALFYANDYCVWLYNYLNGFREDGNYRVMFYTDCSSFISSLAGMKFFEHLTPSVLFNDYNERSNVPVYLFFIASKVRPGDWCEHFWRVFIDPRSEKDLAAMKSIFSRVVALFTGRFALDERYIFDWLIARAHSCPPEQITPSVLLLLKTLSSINGEYANKCMNAMFSFYSESYKGLSVDMRRSIRRTSLAIAETLDQTSIMKLLQLSCDQKNLAPFRVWMLECFTKAFSSKSFHYSKFELAQRTQDAVFELVVAMHDFQLEMLQMEKNPKESNAEYERDLVMVLEWLRAHVIRPIDGFDIKSIRDLCVHLFSKPVCEGEVTVFLKWAISVVPYVASQFTETILEQFVVCVGKNATRSQTELFLSLFCALNSNEVRFVSWDGISPLSVHNCRTSPLSMLNAKSVWLLLSQVSDEVFPLLRDFIVLLFATYREIDGNESASVALRNLGRVLEGDAALRRYVQILSSFINLKKHTFAKLCSYVAAGSREEKDNDSRDSVRLFVSMNSYSFLPIEISLSVSLQKFASECIEQAKSNGMNPRQFNAVLFQNKLYRFLPLEDEDTMSSGDDKPMINNSTILKDIGVRDFDVVELLLAGDSVYHMENYSLFYDRKTNSLLSLEDTRRRAGDTGQEISRESSTMNDWNVAVLSAFSDMKADDARIVLDENHDIVDDAFCAASDGSYGAAMCHQSVIVNHSPSSIVDSLKDEWVISLVSRFCTSSVDAEADASWSILRFLGVLPDDLSSSELVQELLFDPDQHSDDDLISSLKEIERETSCSKDFCESILQSGIGQCVLCGSVTDSVIRRFISNIDSSDKGAFACLQVYSVFLSVCQNLLEYNSYRHASATDGDESVFDGLFTFDAIFEVLCNSPVFLGPSAVNKRIAEQSLHLCLASESNRINRSRVFVSSRCGVLSGAIPCNPVFREEVSRVACSVLFEGGDEAQRLYSDVIKAFVRHESSSVDSGVSEAESKEFIKIALARTLQNGVSKYERVLLRLCLFDRLKSLPSCIPECIFDVRSVKACDATVHEKAGRRTVGHPLFSSGVGWKSALNSSLQQLLLCRGFVDDIFQRDLNTVSDSKRSAVAALKKVVQDCINSKDGCTSHCEQLATEIERYAQTWNKNYSSPHGIWNVFDGFLGLKEVEDLKKPSLRIRFMMTHIKSGFYDQYKKPYLKCKKGTDLEGVLRASKPQLFTQREGAVTHYPDQVMIHINDSFRCCSGDVVPMMQLPLSLTLGNGKEYYLTGLILSPKDDPHKFISCVRTFRSCRSDARKNWALCGADDNHIVHVSQDFVDQYLKGSTIAWARTPIQYVVYTVLDSEDVEALDVKKTGTQPVSSNTVVSVSSGIDEKERELLLLQLFSSRDTLSEFVKNHHKLCEFVLMKYVSALGKQTEFAEMWSALVNNMLSNCEYLSELFLTQQMNDSQFCPTGTRIEEILLSSTSERMRILYEETLCIALRCLETKQGSEVFAHGFYVAFNLEEMEKRFGGLTLFRFVFYLIRLLRPIRHEWPRFKQYFKLLLDIASLSPAMVQLFLSLDIGSLLSAWFSNGKCYLCDFDAFIEPDVCPDLTEYMKLLEFLVTSDLVRSNLKEFMVSRLYDNVFGSDFMSLLLTYPYCPRVIDSLVCEFCHDSIVKSRQVWGVMKRSLTDSEKVGHQSELTKHIFYFCSGILDTITDERLALVLGTKVEYMNDSILTLWTQGNPGENALLSGSLLFSGFCKIPRMREMILANVRKYLWLEFYLRSKVVGQFRQDFAEEFGIKEEDDLYEQTNEFIYALGNPPLIKAYVVMRSACMSLQRSLQKPAPEMSVDDSLLYNQMVENFRNLVIAKAHRGPAEPEQRQHSNELVALPSVAEPADVDEDGLTPEKKAMFQEIKTILGEQFSDDDIRRVVKKYDTLETAVNALFD